MPNLYSYNIIKYQYNMNDSRFKIDFVKYIKMKIAV